MSIDDALKTVDALDRSVNYLFGVAGDALRNAVEDFNAEPMSLSSVDRFRERVLLVADHLAKPLMTEPPEPELIGKTVLAEIHRIGESRRADG